MNFHFHTYFHTCCCQVTFNLYKAEDEDEIKVWNSAELSSFYRIYFLHSPHPQIGEISKKWTGLGEEMFTDADNFGVSFPVDLDIKVT